MENRTGNEYFDELAKELINAVPGGNQEIAHIWDFASQLVGAHHQHLVKGYGREPIGFLEALNPLTREWVKPVLDSHQKEWLKKHPKEYGIDLREPEQGMHIQSLQEAVDRAINKMMRGDKVK